MAKTNNSNVTFWNSVKTRLISVMMLICVVPMAVALIISYESSMVQAVKDAKTKGIQRAEIV